MPIEGAILASLLQACAPNVAPATMNAIIQVESSGDPYRIGVNSGARLSRQPTNRADAIATVRGLQSRGANFDAGLMQINSANMRKYGLTAETVFDPCTNIRVGAAILTDNYARALDAGHPSPLQAAVSEYNTGSRSRGLSNGYVGRVWSAAGQRRRATPMVATAQTGRSWTVDAVAGVLSRAFNARITDTWRPMNASYGARNSFHKYGQAVDFVPRAGLGSITRADIRAVAAANGIQIVELLGPGDPDHDDHWHVAFAVSSSPTRPGDYLAPQPWVVAASVPSQGGAGAVRLSAAYPQPETVELAAQDAAPPPPSWDVFGRAQWASNQSGRR
ncbi:transglycosylase SLT domain-containing protein [Erythrobacter sp. MTPC3]|uniref:transglycosylase SLT domain-containing protein n=1 Tax=Erythrobacter sp. MTPC3 TaxID=3056564 RepID=UPI0036F3290F